MLALLAAAVAVSSPTALPITLGEAYARARAVSEDLAQRGDGVAELEARVDELRSLVLPRLSLRGTETIQDVPPAVSGVSSTFSQRSREEARFALRQPLFSGFREFAAVRAAKAQGAAAELSVRRAEQLLYQDVARAYLDLLGRQREIATRETLAGITRERLAELRERLRLGRSRRSELLAAQAQLSALEAELEAARGAERRAQWLVRFLTGLEQDLAPAPVPVPEPPAEPDLLALARRRADVEARRRELEAARQSELGTRRARWPTAYADGNYYLHRPPGFQDRVKWDVALTADLPLYAGGSITAQVRQAQARARAASRGLDLAARRAELETRTALRDLASALASAAALEKAAAAAQANADAQAQDYRLGLVTNLDVLGSLSAWQQAGLSLEEARLDAALAWVRLQVAAGTAR